MAKGDLLNQLLVDEASDTDEGESSYPDWGSDDIVESAFMNEEEYLKELGHNSIAGTKKKDQNFEPLTADDLFGGDESGEEEGSSEGEDDTAAQEEEQEEVKPAPKVEQQTAPAQPEEQDNRVYHEPSEYRNLARAYFIKDVLRTNNVEHDDKNYASKYNEFMTRIGANDKLVIEDWIREKTDTETARYKENEWSQYQARQTMRQNAAIADRIKTIFPDIAEYTEAMKSHEAMLAEKWPGILEIPAMAVPLLYAMAKVEGVKKTARAVRSDTRRPAGPALEKGSAPSRGGKTSAMGQMVNRAFAAKGAQVRKPLDF